MNNPDPVSMSPSNWVSPEWLATRWEAIAQRIQAPLQQHLPYTDLNSNCGYHLPATHPPCLYDV